MSFDKAQFPAIVILIYFYIRIAGNSKIEVRVSEASKAGNTSQAETEKSNDDEQTKAENLDNVLNDSLDNQIGDLLTAIREEETKSEDTADIEGDCIETTKVKTENVSDEGNTESKSAEVKSESNGEAEVKNVKTEENVENKNVDIVKSETKETGRATPTRTSARIATSTPSTIKTRRASKLSQN